MINRLGTFSFGGNVFSYQIGESPVFGLTDPGARDTKPGDETYSPLSIEGYYVFPAGADNLDPNTSDKMISENRLLPELIEKQGKILYGRRPMLYKDVVNEAGEVSRHYIDDQEISSWLDSWRENGMADSFEVYINKAIRSYYYSEGIFTKWHLSKAQKIGLKTATRKLYPVAGLEHISELRCRMATRTDISQRKDLEDNDFDFVMVGNWVVSNNSEFKVYPRLDYKNPLSRSSCISYSKNPDHGKEIYASNVFFKGIKEWIRGCNLTPSYINSYLENALSARLHVIIPNAWYLLKAKQLEELCSLNHTRALQHKELIKIKVGKHEMEVGEIYSDNLVEEYTKLELKNFSEFMSGAGKNQGKLYATRSLLNDNGDEERWKIEEIPQKYKEYIEALLSYDKRADMVLLSAKGIDSSISNVSSDGVISKSGSDAYYNYLIYLTQQSIPEQIVCADVNYAIKLNFPDKYASGVRVGFYRPTLQRQEDVKPSARMSNQE